MKKFLGAMLSICTLPLMTLQADWGIYDADSEQRLEHSDDRGPLTFFVEGDYYGKSKFDEKNWSKRTKIQYAIVDAEAALVFYYNPCYKEGLVLNAGYVWDRIDWKPNPYFRENTFNTFVTAISAFSERATDWTWKSQVRMNLQLDHFNWNHNLTLDLVLWGRYQTTETIGLNFGFLAYTGMKIDRIIPILGFDWQPNEKWKINAIFPIDISATYKFDDRWSVEINSRFLEIRHRFSKHDPVPHGLIEYRNAGFELGLNYDIGQTLQTNIHAGYLIGGLVNISNKHNNHNKRFNFDSAPYAGGEISVNF